MRNRKKNTQDVKVAKESYLLEIDEMSQLRGGTNDEPSGTDVKDCLELE